MNDVICIHQPWQLVILLVFLWGVIAGVFYRMAFEKIKQTYHLIKGYFNNA